MHRLRHWITVVGILSMLLLPAAVSAAPITNVTPSIGPAGTQFLFFASGFGPRERIYIWLNAPDGTVQAVSQPYVGRTSSYGDASWTWVSPTSMQSGVWQMVAHGRTSQIEQVIPFTIGQPPIPNEGEAYNVTPSSGLPGTLFRFFAAGFNPRETVTITIQGPSGELKKPILVNPGATTDEGRIDGSWSSPLDATPGAWQIIIRGVDSKLERAIPVTLTSNEGTTANLQLRVQPASGAPGARFIFTASGLYPNEDLRLWLNMPDGNVVAADIEGIARSASDGGAGWTWVAPENAQPGTWQMVAHGVKANDEVVATFTITAP